MKVNITAKITPFLWFDRQAGEGAQLYLRSGNSACDAIHESQPELQSVVESDERAEGDGETLFGRFGGGRHQLTFYKIKLML